MKIFPLRFLNCSLLNTYRNDNDDFAVFASVVIQYIILQHPIVREGYSVIEKNLIRLFQVFVLEW